MPDKKTQRELALDYLKSNPDRFIPAYEFVGEVKIGFTWYYMSYSVPKRLSELFKDGLVDRQLVKGKSGVYYYAYKTK